MTGIKGRPKYTNSSCNIKGVPRSTYTYAATTSRNSLKDDTLQKARRMPSGIASTMVIKKSRKVSTVPISIWGIIEII